MITNGIKLIADFIMSLFSFGTSAENNYKQFPLPLAILVCLVTLVALGLLASAGVMVLLNYLK